MKAFLKKYKAIWITIISLVIIYGGIYIAGDRCPVGMPAWAFFRSLRLDYRPLVVTIPAVVMPSPNAFDTYFAAYKLTRDDKEIRKAFDNPKTSSTEMQKYVKDNTPAIKLIRIGLTRQYLPPGSSSEDSLFPYLSRWITLHKVILMDARIKAQQGVRVLHKRHCKPFSLDQEFPTA